MKKLLFIFLLPISVQAQTISVSPGSVIGISKTAYAPEISIGYKFLSTSLIYKPYDFNIHDRHPIKQLYVGLFLSPKIDFNNISVSPLLGIFNKRFLSEYGTRINFGVTFSRRITKDLSIYFKHLSNAGMGANPGIDNIGISVSI